MWGLEKQNVSIKIYLSWVRLEFGFKYWLKHYVLVDYSIKRGHLFCYKVSQREYEWNECIIKLGTF